MLKSLKKQTREKEQSFIKGTLKVPIFSQQNYFCDRVVDHLRACAEFFSFTACLPAIIISRIHESQDRHLNN